MRLASLFLSLSLLFTRMTLPGRGGASGQAADSATLNVKTVLFSDEDGMKACWSKSEVDLLVARRLLQDLVPRKPPKDFPVVLKYLRSSIDVLKTKVPPCDQPVMTKAMYDVFGGYLKAVVIPMANEAYYAGNIDYETTADLHAMLGEMMASLGTDGSKWAAPVDMAKIPTKVAALPMTLCKHEESCEALTLDTEPSYEKTEDENRESKVPMPFLDDRSYPNSIAVPFKDHSLFSLMTKCSSDLLPKYYIVSMRCLSGPGFQKQDLVDYNHQLHRWIISYVVPHLHDPERWYPGFGAVMRIVETMNQRGMASNLKTDMASSSNEAIVGQNVCINRPSEWPWTTLECDTFPYAMLIIVVLILGTCLFLCCYFYKRRRERMCSDEEDGGLLSALTNIYLGKKDSIKRESKFKMQSDNKTTTSYSSRTRTRSRTSETESTTTTSSLSGDSSGRASWRKPRERSSPPLGKSKKKRQKEDKSKDCKEKGKWRGKRRQEDPGCKKC